MLINIHTHVPRQEKGVYRLLSAPTLDWMQQDRIQSDLPFTLGVHPWWIGKCDLKRALQFVRENIDHPGCVGVGETGLDRAIQQDWQEQIDLFERQVELAEKRLLVVHCVRAYPDTARILKAHGFKGKVLFHDYNGDVQTTQQLLKFNSYFSYGDKLYRPESRGHRSFLSIPRERLFFETDDQQNRSIQETYRDAAKLLDMNQINLVEMCQQNLTTLFS